MERDALMFYKISKLDTIAPPDVLKTAISDYDQQKDLHKEDFVLVLRGDETWRYGMFVCPVSKSHLMRIQVGKIENGKMPYKDVPSSHVKLIKTWTTV